MYNICTCQYQCSYAVYLTLFEWEVKTTRAISTLNNSYSYEIIVHQVVNSFV